MTNEKMVARARWTALSTGLALGIWAVLAGCVSAAGDHPIEDTESQQANSTDTVIEAESFSAKSAGLHLLSSGSVLASGNAYMGWSVPNDYVAFNNVNLSGVTEIRLRTATPDSNVSFELRQGSPTGPLLGKVAASNTGSWAAAGKWSTAATALAAASGVQNLYVVWRGRADLDQLVLVRNGAGGVDAGQPDGNTGGNTPTYSCTKYVSPSGSLHGNHAFTTIQAGVDTLAAGETLCVGAGTYVEQVRIGKSGTASSPIQVFAYPNELPVIDGQLAFPKSKWSALVELNGNYIHVLGFEVKNTSNLEARGVQLMGHHNTVSRMNVHHTYSNGILILGDNGIVEDSRVWQACRNNVNGQAGGWGSGLSSARDVVNGITDNAIIRRNLVYNNWGEGLSTYESQGTLIEDNVVYDNYAQNAYISDASNVIFRRNLVYNTANNVGRHGSQTSSSLADERSDKPRSTNNVVVNNLFMNGDVNLFSWTIVSGSGLTNALFAHNTLVNARVSTGNINSNSRIINNIFAAGGSAPSASGITWRSNLWQGTRPASAVGANDVVADPLLAKTGTIAPGAVTADYFKLSSASSPAVNRATALSEVTQDYFKAPRGTSPDIGADEY